jgi:hypothetical protein
MGSVADSSSAPSLSRSSKLIVTTVFAKIFIAAP